MLIDSYLLPRVSKECWSMPVIIHKNPNLCSNLVSNTNIIYYNTIMYEIVYYLFH